MNSQETCQYYFCDSRYHVLVKFSIDNNSEHELKLCKECAEREYEAIDAEECETLISHRAIV